MWRGRKKSDQIAKKGVNNGVLLCSVYPLLQREQVWICACLWTHCPCNVHCFHFTHTHTHEIRPAWQEGTGYYGVCHCCLILISFPCRQKVFNPQRLSDIWKKTVAARNSLICPVTVSSVYSFHTLIYLWQPATNWFFYFWQRRSPSPST